MRTQANGWSDEAQGSRPFESAPLDAKEVDQHQGSRFPQWHGSRPGSRAFSEPPMFNEKPRRGKSGALDQLVTEMKRTSERISVYKRTINYLLEVCDAVLVAERSTSHLKTTDDLDKIRPNEFIANVKNLLLDLAHQSLQDSLIRWHETEVKANELLKASLLAKAGAQRSRASLAVSSQDSQRISFVLAEDVSHLADIVISGILWPDSQHNFLRNVRGPKAQALANLLYEGLASNKDKRSRRRTERALRKLCGRAGILPSTFYLKRDQLRRISASAVACGGFADIYEGVFQEKKVAMKVLRISNGHKATKARESFYKEAVYWRDLAHPHIVPFLGLADPDMLPLCMVSAWMPHGNLLSYLKNYPRANRMNLISDIFAGLYHLHRLGIVHGDLKSGNVLIDADYHARLADFGLARVMQEPSTLSLMQTSSSVYGSLRWMAPELLIPPNDTLNTPKLCAETDAYASGMVMLEAFTGKIPFHDQSHDAFVVINVARGIRPARPYEALNKGLTDNVWGLITDCWQTDAHFRPRMEEIRARFESERAKFEPPEATSPEECEEVENLISITNGNDYEEFEDDNASFDSDIEDSFVRQDLTRMPSDRNDMLSGAKSTTMRFELRSMLSQSSSSFRSLPMSSSSATQETVRLRTRGSAKESQVQDDVDELASIFESRMGTV